jgi:hypothetical protein
MKKFKVLLQSAFIYIVTSLLVYFILHKSFAGFNIMESIINCIIFIVCYSITSKIHEGNESEN